MIEKLRAADALLKNKFKKQGGIKAKIIAGVSILGLVLLLVIGLIVFFVARNWLLNSYELLAYSYTGTASKLINGDSIARYMASPEKDEYYYTVDAYLNGALFETDLVYFSVFVPLEDELLYIWDGDKGEDLGYDLGYREPYLRNEKEAVAEIYRQDPPEHLYHFVSEEYGNLAVAYSPIFNSDNEPVAVAEADLSLDYIKTNLTNIMWIITLILIVVIGGLGILELILTKTIVAPIRDLSQASVDLVENLKNDQPFRFDIHTGDEIEMLANSFEHMDTELRAYIKENTEITAERERIVTELSLAASIQKDMLPGKFPAFPDKTEIDIYAAMTPAREVGGDFYDFFLIDDRHIALVMADVSGKGIPAALFMMKSMIMLRNSAMSGNSPKAVLEEVNNELCRNNQEKMFVTVWFGILDLDSGRLIAANGGHEYPIFRKPEGLFELIKDKHGFVLGGISGMRYTEYELQMDPGACLFVYTDGVPEATDKDQNFFGTERTVAALNRQPAETPQALLNNISMAVADFVQDASQFDDLTMMSVKYLGKPERKPADTEEQQNAGPAGSGSSAWQPGDVRTAEGIDVVKPEMEIQVAPVIENIQTVTNFVIDDLKDRGCSAKIIRSISIVIDEIFGNIVKHGKRTENNPVTVRKEFETGPSSLVLTFEDDNAPFDPLAREDPNTALPAKKRVVGGLGIFMVKKSVDDIQYEYKDGKNILTIKKYLK